MKPTVLIVMSLDDAVWACELLLGRQGYATWVATEWEEALAIVRDTRPALILTEHSREAPAMIGRVREIVPNMPFVMIVVHQAVLDYDAMNRVTVMRFPIRPRDLVQAVDDFLA